MAQLLIQPITTDAGDPTEEMAAPRPLPSKWLVRLLVGGMMLVAAAGFGGWLLLIAAHWQDRYMTDLPATSYMTQAWYLSNGTLYPEMFDGSNYAGTRYMPLPVLLHAGMAMITGEFLGSGKLVAYASMVSALGVVVGILRSLKCGWTFALGLAAMVLVTPAGMEAGNSIRGDVLAIALQLGAIAVISRTDTRRSAVYAGLLTAGAVLCKSSAVWGMMTIWMALLIQNRRLLMVYTLTAAASFTVVFGSLHLLSAGRITENILGLTTSGVRHWSDLALWAPGRVFTNMREGAPILLVTLPLALASCAIAMSTRRFNLYHFALPMAGAVTLVIHGDVGAGANHVLDVLVLSLILTGDLWAAITDSPVARVFSPAQIITVICVMWASVMTIPMRFLRDVREAAAVVTTGTRSAAYARDPLAGVVKEGDIVLSEDPYIPLVLGQTPVVADSFMLIDYERAHPEWIGKLAGRIKNREFTKIVMRTEPDAKTWWNQHVSWGATLTRAIGQHYGVIERRHEYVVLAPADGMRQAYTEE